MRQKTALISGVTGHDGAYLAEILLENGCDAHGMKRHTSCSIPTTLITSTRTRMSRIAVSLCTRVT